jgi:hypothetical protein
MSCSAPLRVTFHALLCLNRPYVLHRQAYAAVMCGGNVGCAVHLRLPRCRCGPSVTLQMVKMHLRNPHPEGATLRDKEVTDVLSIISNSHMHHCRCRGHSFLKVNEELLDIYAACDTSQQVIAAQQAHLARMAAGQAQAAARKSAPISVSA